MIERVEWVLRGISVGEIFLVGGLRNDVAMVRTMLMVDAG